MSEIDLPAHYGHELQCAPPGPARIACAVPYEDDSDDAVPTDSLMQAIPLNGDAVTSVDTGTAVAIHSVALTHGTLVWQSQTRLAGLAKGATTATDGPSTLRSPRSINTTTAYEETDVYQQDTVAALGGVALVGPSGSHVWLAHSATDAKILFDTPKTL